MTGPRGLCDHFRRAGLDNFLPAWSPSDHAAIAADGKIPSYPRWRESLASGRIGLDALSALDADLGRDLAIAGELGEGGADTL